MAAIRFQVLDLMQVSTVQDADISCMENLRFQIDAAFINSPADQ